jgi:hypothetical protein
MSRPSSSLDDAAHVARGHANGAADDKGKEYPRDPHEHGSSSIYADRCPIARGTLLIAFANGAQLGAISTLVARAGCAISGGWLCRRPIARSGLVRMTHLVAGRNAGRVADGGSLCGGTRSGVHRRWACIPICMQEARPLVGFTREWHAIPPCSLGAIGLTRQLACALRSPRASRQFLQRARIT